MRFQSWLTCMAGLVLVALMATDAQAQKKPVKFTKEWKGSVADQNLQKGAPAFITDAKAPEKLWKDWKIADKMPAVDFNKEIVILATTVGSKLNLKASLDDKGNLEVFGMATLDIADGFRYVMATVPREGIKTVNKKELPK